MVPLNPNREITATIQKCPPFLKVNKGSHLIKKNNHASTSPPASSLFRSTLPKLTRSGSGRSSSSQPPQREPLIIYSRTPKVIRVHPSDFKALVQKLTGLARSDNDDQDASNTSTSTYSSSSSNDLAQPKKQESNYNEAATFPYQENDYSSVMSNGNDFGFVNYNLDESLVNSSFTQSQVPITMFEPSISHFPPSNAFTKNLPMFTSDASPPSNKTFINYIDPLFFNHNNMMYSTAPSPSSDPSCAPFEGVNEYDSSERFLGT